MRPEKLYEIDLSQGVDFFKSFNKTSKKVPRLVLIPLTFDDNLALRI